MSYAPTIFERYSITYKVTNYKVHCTIWDTSGTSSYDTVRPLAYPETHVFILCFSISDPSTLENIITKWYPEVRRYCQTTPLILCGCQSDLRNDFETLAKLAELQRIPVPAEQGVAVSRQIGATLYVETSSKTCPKAIQDAFEVSALAALGKLNKNLPTSHKFGSHRYHGTWHRAKVDLNFRDRSRNCVVM